MTGRPDWLRGDGDVRADGSEAGDAIRIQTIICGRCGWPNGCRVQSGMRVLRFMCQWCGRMTTGIVDPSVKKNVIF